MRVEELLTAREGNMGNCHPERCEADVDIQFGFDG